jgi:hypothetical protein
LPSNDVASMASSLEQRVPLVDQVLFESVERLPDQARYRPLGGKAAHRPARPRPGAVERPKSGFVLPFERWIRRGLKDAMDQTLRDPAGHRLQPASTPQRWSGSGGPSSTGHLACISRGSGRYISSSDGATATASSDEATAGEI